jgi:hypothetical protein
MHSHLVFSSRSGLCSVWLGRDRISTLRISHSIIGNLPTISFPKTNILFQLHLGGVEESLMNSLYFLSSSEENRYFHQTFFLNNLQKKTFSLQEHSPFYNYYFTFPVIPDSQYHFFVQDPTSGFRGMLRPTLYQCKRFEATPCGLGFLEKVQSHVPAAELGVILEFRTKVPLQTTRSSPSVHQSPLENTLSPKSSLSQ